MIQQELIAEKADKILVIKSESDKQGSESESDKQGGKNGAALSCPLTNYTLLGNIIGNIMSTNNINIDCNSQQQHTEKLQSKTLLYSTNRIFIDVAKDGILVTKLHTESIFYIIYCIQNLYYILYIVDMIQDFSDIRSIVVK